MTDSVKVYAPSPMSNILDANSFWEIPYWTTGSTHEGSSGSPLFDKEQLVIGGLTGGSSRCNGVNPNGKADYFSIIGKSWETGNPDNQLKTYLDPVNKGVVQYAGMDPHGKNPIIRLTNANYTKGDKLITSRLDSPNEGFIFGNNNLQTLEFAEEFAVTDEIEIFGAYLLIPAIPSNSISGVTVSVYTGDSSPETKVGSASFIPQYRNYSSSLGFHFANKTFTVPTETFVLFKDGNGKPISVTSKKFFISYSIDNSTNANFCVYNTEWNGGSSTNTAWLKEKTKGWVQADKYEVKPMKTALAIHPLIRKTNNNQIENIKVPETASFYFERSDRTLTLMEPLGNKGQIAVYSVGGQLLETIRIQPGQTAFTLRERQKGTIGIVKISCNSYFCTGKIIY
jgi:hypothetical protein